MGRSNPIKREIPRGSRGGVVGYGTNNAPTAIAPSTNGFFLQTGNASANAQFTSLTAPGFNEEIMYNNGGGMAAATDAHYTSSQYLSVREGTSSVYAYCEGAHSHINRNTALYPWTTTSGTVFETLVSQTLSDNTIVSYGKGFSAWFAGTNKEKAPGDTSQIRVRVGASGLESTIYDSGVFTCPAAGTGVSGDQNTVLDGGNLIGWRIDIDFYLYDSANQYFMSSAKFTCEDPAIVAATKALQVNQTLSQATYGGAGDIYILLEANDSAAGSTTVYGGKVVYTQPGPYEL